MRRGFQSICSPTFRTRQISRLCFLRIDDDDDGFHSPRTFLSPPHGGGLWGYLNAMVVLYNRPPPTSPVEKGVNGVEKEGGLRGYEVPSQTQPEELLKVTVLSMKSSDTCFFFFLLPLEIPDSA